MPKPDEPGLVKWINPEPLEKTLEEWFRRRVQALGGKAWKFVSPANRSVPDRIVMLPSHPARPCLFLVELKRKGQRLTAKQADEVAFMRRLGARVYVADTKYALECIVAFELAVFADNRTTGHEGKTPAQTTSTKGRRLASAQADVGTVPRHGSGQDGKRADRVRGTAPGKP